MEISLTRSEARLYQLWAVRLHSASYPPGDSGIRGLFSDIGSIQLDPLPVLGRNHDLIVQSRIDGTHPGDLLRIVHEERIGSLGSMGPIPATSSGSFTRSGSGLNTGIRPYVRFRLMASLDFAR